MTGELLQLPIALGARLAAEVGELYQHGLPTGYATGWHAIDQLYRPTPGQWTVVTGIPGSGKSSWLDALLVNLAVRHDFCFAVYSPEAYPTARHAAALCSRYLGKPFGPGPTPRMTRDELDGALEWVTEHFTWLEPASRDPITLLQTAAEWRRSSRKPFGIVLDPWNALEHMRPASQPETLYVSETLTYLTHLVRQEQCHAWIVAHPAKLERQSDGRRPVPTPYDIAGSAHWYNKADCCVTVHRDQAQQGGNLVDVHVQKVRFTVNGSIGVAQLRFDRLTGRYHDLPEAVEDAADDYRERRARY